MAFLQGKDFEWNQEVSDMFGHIGHINQYEYDLDFWKVKLMDSWVRDNCYKLNLFKDPYYDLIKLKANPKRVQKVLGYASVSIDDGLYIAGGAAMYMANITDTYHDVDIFSTNLDHANRIINQVIQEQGSVYATSNSVTLSPDVQLILRQYSCPSEIVHGFDVGCCGVIFDGKDLWCTQRAYYCIKHKCNWLEPDRSSPSYIYRLCKYHKRGFKIKIPFESKLQFKNIDHIREAAREYCLEYATHLYFPRITHDYLVNVEPLVEEAKKYVLDPSVINELVNYESYISRDTTEFDIYTVYGSFMLMYYILANPDINPIVLALSTWSDEYDNEIRKLLPVDPASVLFLHIYYNINYGLTAKPISDYNQKPKAVDDIAEIQWKTQNPMEQLTGSFCPQSITDLWSWYQQSPLLKE